MITKRHAWLLALVILGVGELTSSVAQERVPLEDVVRQAREVAREGRWDEARLRLEPAIGASEGESPAVRASAIALVAESLWHAGQAKEALSRIDAGRHVIQEARAARPLVVLEADILFAEGRVDEACALYTTAESVASSPWVRMQSRRCAIPASGDTAAKEPSQ